MTQAALKPTPILRTASGEPPLGPEGKSFRDDQGEIVCHDNPRYATAARIGVLQLDDGGWLTTPPGPGFKVDGLRYDTREDAIQDACESLMALARLRMAAGEGEGTSWTADLGNAVIQWAQAREDQAKRDARRGALLAIEAGKEVDKWLLREMVAERLVHVTSMKVIVTEEGRAFLASSGGRADEAAAREHFDFVEGGEPRRQPEQPRNDVQAGMGSERPSPPDQPISEDGLTWCDTLTDQMAGEELTIAGYEASDAGAGLSDPVVKYLVEQHRLRKQFPAKHAFSITTEVADGRIVSVATCACKQVIKFPTNDPLRMDAAIEAHWRRFSHEPTVDGRGAPIIPGVLPGSKKRKRKSSDGGVEGHAGSSGRSKNLGAGPQAITGSIPVARPVHGEAGVEPGPSDPNIARVPDAPQGERSEPAPTMPPNVPSGAGSPLSSHGDGGPLSPIASASPIAAAGDADASLQAAPIGAGESVVTSPDDIPDDWSPLLRAAHALAWRGEDARPVKLPHEPDEIESKLQGKLLGPSERIRETVVLRGEPIDGGPLFGSLPPPSDDVMEAET
jgi:hypothetical protein